MGNTVEVSEKVTAKHIGAALSALVINTRGKLACIGGMILAYGKAHGHESKADTLDALETELKLQKMTLDKSLCNRALKAHADRKTANEKGVYAEWSKASTDAEAQAILDKACNKERKEKTPKSDLSKVLALIAKLDAAGLSSALTAIEAQLSAIEAAKASTSKAGTAAA